MFNRHVLLHCHWFDIACSYQSKTPHACFPYGCHIGMTGTPSSYRGYMWYTSLPLHVRQSQRPSKLHVWVVWHRLLLWLLLLCGGYELRSVSQHDSNLLPLSSLRARALYYPVMQGVAISCIRIITRHNGRYLFRRSNRQA